MKIIKIAISDPTYMDSYQKLKNPNILFDPIISVMGKHIYETSNIFEIVSVNNSDENDNKKSYLSEEIESEINKEGIRVLEKLFNQNEFLKLIKNLKENINSFIPGKALPQAIEQLENNLLLTYCALKIKNFFDVDLKGIVESLNNIIRKEVTYIEGYKREKSGKTQDEEESINDTINSSSKRLLLQIGIIKQILDNCIKNYNEARSFITDENTNETNPNFVNCGKYIEVIKEILKIYSFSFDKSNDNDNVINALENLSKNIGFFLNNEKEIDNNYFNLKKNNEANNIKGNNSQVKNLNNNNDTDNNSIMTKITNDLINLLRKNLDNYKICDCICSVLSKFCKKNLEICDLLVKLGCPRYLLSIIENSNNANLTKKGLDLLMFFLL